MASSSGTSGSSLWLIPPEGPLKEAMSQLINSTLPQLFAASSPPNFSPHITISASTIPADLPDPQEWLDSLPLPELSGLKLRVGELEVGDIVFQKLIQLCEKNEALCELAATCRSAGTGESVGEAREWIESNCKPHVSLM